VLARHEGVVYPSLVIDEELHQREAPELILFPWEEKEKDNGDGAAVTKGTSSEERVKELVGRMKRTVNSSF